MKSYEKYLYQGNTISQSLLMVFIIGNTIFTIYLTNHANVDYDLGLFILLNIFLTLVTFLVAVRQKMYSYQSGYAGIAVAVFQFFRLLWIPDEIVNPLLLRLQGLLVLSATAALAGSIICLIRTRQREHYIVENKVDRELLQK